MQEQERVNNQAHVSEELRSISIRWMKMVGMNADLSHSVQDLAIRCFDRVINAYDDTIDIPIDQFYALSAVTAIIVSVKTDSTKSSFVAMSKFPEFHNTALVAFECVFLKLLDYRLCPNITSSAFSRYLLSLWQDRSLPYAKIQSYVDLFISEFWEDPTSVRFAPSTIAISALMLSFAVQFIDCREWLDEFLPDVCIPKAANVFYSKHADTDLFNIDACLERFQHLHCVQILITTSQNLRASAPEHARIQSPTSVTTDHESEKCLLDNLKFG